MRKMFFAALAAVAIFSSIISGQAIAGERTVTLGVEKMTCAACPFIVKGSLTKIQGVSDVSVSLASKTATVTFDDGKTTLAALVEATTNAGYPSRPQP